MTAELRPYDQFDTDELADGLHEIVARNRTLLKRRRLLGVIARYGKSLERAKRNVEKGQHETEAGKLPHFALMDETGEISGQASVFPGLELVRVSLPLHPKLQPRFFAKRFAHANPNISAWSTEERPHLLKPAYQELRARNYSFIPASGVRDIAWTIEPLTSPRYVHDAIAASGLSKEASRLYYDGESRFVVGPGTLYADTSEWLTSHGRHQELASGDWHGSTEEVMSRNPAGR